MIFDQRPVSHPMGGLRRWGQNSHFSKHGHVAHQIKEMGIGSVGQNSTFSEHGHVAYQIKENQECSNMVASILLAEAFL